MRAAAAAAAALAAEPLMVPVPMVDCMARAAVAAHQAAQEQAATDKTAE